MQVFNANYFEDYGSYISRKKSASSKSRKIRKGSSKKEKEKKKVLKNNSIMSEIADNYVERMKGNPSELEKRMQAFLNSFNINYEFQKVFSIKKKNGYILKFYIADFYIPSKNLIIETDGAFHDNQVEEDTARTTQIKENYPNVKVIRWRWHDFDSYSKMQNLLKEIR